MFNWKEFDKAKEILGHMGGSRYRDSWGQHHLRVRPIDLLDWIKFLKEDLDYLTMTEIASLDHGAAAPFRFEIVYHLLNMGTHQRLNLHLIVDSGEKIPSVAEYYPHAEWMEREQAEMLDLNFERKQAPLILPVGQLNFPLRKDAQFKEWPVTEASKLPLLRFNPNKSEAPYPEESYQWKRFDLTSPETMGNFEWLVCFDPVKVVDSKVQIGFHHQGLELLLQNKDILQILQLADKVTLSAAPHYSVAWTKTIEDMYRIKIPERAQALRIVFLELSRIADHLTVLQSICFHADLGEYRFLLNAREKVYELFEKYSGFRHGLGIAKIGGVQDDLPPGWIIEYQTVAEVLSKKLNLIHKSLIGQEKFRKLLGGESVNAQSVLQGGVSGPAMRAAGLNFDLRKSQPFYFYQDIDFDIPVGIHGTGYDRYLIRLEEIFQSLRIITQVIDNLPLGKVVDEAFDQNYLELTAFFKRLETPKEWHYSALETPSGEGGFLVQLESQLKPSRIKIKTPSFVMAEALPIFVKGLREEQLKICLASLGLSRWEIDR
ncbi:MAG: NADH-quinone oxidoreductase subunit C [Bacteriovoracaceae bacterium]|nr:NADH-quinone oxidoreductase subunit C [Bacteriovoracaceae bacterium]